MHFITNNIKRKTCKDICIYKVLIGLKDAKNYTIYLINCNIFDSLNEINLNIKRNSLKYLLYDIVIPNKLLIQIIFRSYVKLIIL